MHPPHLVIYDELTEFQPQPLRQPNHVHIDRTEEPPPAVHHQMVSELGYLSRAIDRVASPHPMSNPLKAPYYVKVTPKDKASRRSKNKQAKQTRRRNRG